MREILLRYLAPHVAVLSWRGPGGDNQDFHLASLAIEVKTTSSTPHEKVAVSNVLQLDDTSVSTLVMAHIALDPRRNSGETLPEIVEGIRQTIDASTPNMAGEFNSLLVKAGYLEAHREQYVDTGYGLRHVRYYRVAYGFPRLLEQDLPSGVGDVRYTVMMSACGPFEITDDALMDLVKGREV